MMVRVYIILLSVKIFTKLCDCFKYEDKRRRMAFIFNTSRYDKSVRPVHDSTTPTRVAVSQTVRAITNVDVSTGLMCSFSFLTFSWTDELLTWNSTDYGGITEMSLPSEKIWNPELEKTFAGACTDSDDEERFPSLNVTLTYQGSVYMFVAKSIGALCEIDMTSFPFDRHVCIHHFYSPQYTPAELTIHFKRSYDIFDINTYKENQEWEVQKAEVSVMNYSELSVSVTYAAIHITIKRRQPFVIIHNCSPCWLISIPNFFTPLVPPDSERLSFAITIYLAMVFLNISFVTEIPRNSVEIILLSKYLLALNIFATIGIIWSIFIVCLSNTSADKARIPIMLQKLVRKSCKERKRKAEEYKSESSDTTEAASEPDHITAYAEVDETCWYDVSRYFDKVFFVISVLLVGALNGIIFQMIYAKQFEEMRY